MTSSSATQLARLYEENARNQKAGRLVDTLDRVWSEGGYNPFTDAECLVEAIETADIGFWANVAMLAAVPAPSVSTQKMVADTYRRRANREALSHPIDVFSRLT